MMNLALTGATGTQNSSLNPTFVVVAFFSQIIYKFLIPFSAGKILI